MATFAVKAKIVLRDGEAPTKVTSLLAGGQSDPLVYYKPLGSRALVAACIFKTPSAEASSDARLGLDGADGADEYVIRIIR